MPIIEIAKLVPVCAFIINESILLSTLKEIYIYIYQLTRVLSPENVKYIFAHIAGKSIVFSFQELMTESIEIPSSSFLK